MTHGIFYCGHILEYDRHLEREKEFVCYDCGSNDVDVLIDKYEGHVRRYIYDEKDKEILMGFLVWECKNCQQHPENCSPCGRTGYHGIAFRKQDLGMYKLQYSPAEREKHRTLRDKHVAQREKERRIWYPSTRQRT